MLVMLFSCDSGSESFIPYTDLEGSPVLPPEKAINTFLIEDGFEIDLIASEPLIHDPVALDFDQEGNIWVIEMMGYMPNIDGTLENVPNGSIKKLVDSNKDGVPDQAITVLDSLVLPRALKLIYGGILYAEPPNLWFSELDGNKILSKQLVDSTYAVGGNVEHQPNGLLLGIDNWIYSAKSTKRYKRKEDSWIIEETEFRGQWGISQTVDGLLAYNTNSNQLRGDLIPPSNVVRNKGIRRSVTTNVEWVSDQRVYPIRPNVVNRGYTEGMLDSLGRLTSFTAASGPVVYTGGSFPAVFSNNGFVPEPSGNLIKRNILEFSPFEVQGRQNGTVEFLASSDERLRPVNVYVGPDGNLYVVDMYRGIIQHISYLTNYLKSHIRETNLDKPVGLGRIYRIRHVDAESEPFSFSTSADRKESLGHSNMWVRMTAQRLMIDRNESDAAKEVLFSSANTTQRIHALWVLEALGDLTINELEAGEQARFNAHLVYALRNTLTGQNASEYLRLLKAVSDQEQSALAVALVLGDLNVYMPEASKVLATELLDSFDNPVMHEAILSSFSGEETSLESPGEEFEALVSQIVENKKPRALPDVIPRGSRGLYEAHCATCHGNDGEGIQTLGPPLAGSEWVTDDQDRLIAVVLWGMEGPVHVRGKKYEVPEIAPAMPGIRLTETLGNSNVTAILNYIRTHWGNDAEPLTEADIQKIRLQYQDRTKPFREEDWLK